MTASNDLSMMVPGFEFLQTLMKGAGAALPGMPGMAAVPGLSQWIAPTLDPEELAKRIQELKTVQFWLEQNARLLGTTIQALEVQRMTLSTLKTMNLPMADLREALKARVPEPVRAPAPAPAPPPEPEPEPEPAAAADKPAPAPAIDPMLWWGALTQQFTEIASQAMKPAAGEGAAGTAGAKTKAQPKPARKVVRKSASKTAVKAPARSQAKR